MKKDEIIVGTLVTLRTESDANIYRVSLINDDGVHLENWRLDGDKANCGVIHWTSAYRPTRTQIANRINELDEWFDKHPEYDGKEANAPAWEEYRYLQVAYAQLPK